jgi:hypothetical protein
VSPNNGIHFRFVVIVFLNPLNIGIELSLIATLLEAVGVRFLGELFHSRLCRLFELEFFVLVYNVGVVTKQDSQVVL